MRRLLVVSLLLLVGCAKQTQIMTPGDGQPFTIEQYQPGQQFFQVQLADNDYTNNTIEFRGLKAVANDVTCTTGVGALSQCVRAYSAIGTSGGFGSCDANHPCTVTIFVRKNGIVQSAISVDFVHGTGTATVPTR